jgi:hypothetical protein
MNAMVTSYPVRIVWFSLTMLIGAGCQSFRTEAYTYQELERRNQEQREINQLSFPPGTTFYSH